VFMYVGGWVGAWSSMLLIGSGTSGAKELAVNTTRNFCDLSVLFRPTSTIRYVTGRFASTCHCGRRTWPTSHRSAKVEAGGRLRKPCPRRGCRLTVRDGRTSNQTPIGVFGPWNWRTPCMNSDSTHIEGQRSGVSLVPCPPTSREQIFHPF
jgi:hypothetical protein